MVVPRVSPRGGWEMLQRQQVPDMDKRKRMDGWLWLY